MEEGVKVLPQEYLDMGFTLEDLSPEEKTLLEEVLKKKQQLMEVTTRVQKTKDDIQQIREESKRCDELLKNKEALIRMKETERKMSEHITALTERKIGYLKQQCHRMKKEIESYNETNDNLQRRISQGKHKQEEFRQKMNWDKQTLEAFIEESARDVEDRIASIKYAHQDNQKIKSLTVAIEKITLEVNEASKACEKQSVDIKSSQTASDNILKEMKQVQLEMQQLTHQFEANIKQIKQRDDEMKKMSLQLAQANQDKRERMATIKKSNQLLDIQRKKNKDTKTKIDAETRQVVKLRQEVEKEEEKCQMQGFELKTCKYTLVKASADIASLTSTISKMKEEKQDMDCKVQKAIARHAALEEKLKSVTQTALSEGERAAEMDLFLKDEEKAVKKLHLQRRDANQKLLNAKQRLQATKMKEKDLLSGISKSKSIIKNLESCLRKQETELSRKQKLVSKQETQLTSLQSKLSRLQGHLPFEEKQEIKAIIAEMKKKLTEKKQAANALINRLRDLEFNSRLLRNKLEKSNVKKTELKDRVKELTILNGNKKTELKRLRLKKQDWIVKQQRLKKEIKRLSDKINKKANSVLSAEKNKLELEAYTKERLDEFKLQKEALKRQRRSCEKEIRKYKMELNEKLKKIDHLKKRYEIKTYRIAAPEGEDPVTYFINKVQREAVDRRLKRDALAAEIKKLKMENKALKNQNQRDKNRNTEMWKSLRRFKKPVPNQQQLQQKLELEEKLKVAQQNLKSKEKQRKELQQDLQEKESNLQRLQEEEEVAKITLEEKQKLMSKLKAKAASQQESIARSKKQCSKLIKAIREAAGTDTETFEEKDIRLRQMKEMRRNVNKMLAEIIQDNSELKSVLEKYFQQAGIPLPSLPSTSSSSRRSSKPGTACSSTSLRCPTSSASSVSGAFSGLSGPVTVKELVLELPGTSNKLPSIEIPSRASSSHSTTSTNTSINSLQLPRTSNKLPSIQTPSRASSTSSNSSSKRKFKKP